MKHKKTFWRGFGAGVLFAAVILGISCLLRTSDAQVVARAKKLGMVYETSDSNALALKSKDQEQKATKEPKQTDAAATQKPVQSIDPAASEDHPKCQRRNHWEIQEMTRKPRKLQLRNLLTMIKLCRMRKRRWRKKSKVLLKS